MWRAFLWGGANEDGRATRGANDVPISQISRMIEIELREALGESELPAPLRPENGIAI